MNNELSKYSKNSDDDQKKIRKDYAASRNILNVYTKEQLSKISNIDLYLMMDLDNYRNKEIPPSILAHVTRVKKRQYHPDVSKGAREAFLLVELANKILGDKRLRNIYDSSFFHVEMPEDRIYQAEEFKEVFGKIFKEYSRFTNNAPSLDDDATKFYDFWRNYKSNRVYIPIDEYINLSPDDRLNYTRQHAEYLTKLKNEDIKKLKEIVQICYKRDPRLRSISDQIRDLRIEKENEWSVLEINTLKRLLILFGKTKKNKFEIITDKLINTSKIKRSVKEVIKKSEELKK
ncbi:zuotin (ZUO1) [Vairimorpha necatrix]|uniref:Zuotin (ZUO1) n=1 Tax=Vairimorpha necatrix TaxID=6039 RepID=A0AAX4JDE8_9MICR